jgi:hypothetical protein
LAFSSANSTPDASRATTPVDDIETFDPSRPSLSPGDSILLPIGKIPAYLDAALKALTLHTEARTSFITYASSLLPPSLSSINLMSESLFFSSHASTLASKLRTHAPTQILAAEFTQTRIHRLALYRAVIVRKGGPDARFAYA